MLCRVCYEPTDYEDEWGPICERYKVMDKVFRERQRVQWKRKKEQR